MAVANLPPTTPRGGATSPTQHRSPNKASMTPNIANVVLGNLHVKPWYPSFYPEDLIGGRKADFLYVAVGGMFGGDSDADLRKKVCPMKSEPPPGTVVYAKDDFIIREVDGEEHKLYCQNLSLFAKLFLETKSVFFDASTFLYYTLTLKSTSENPHGQVAGFFSKEKMSWDNNNLACILIFPPFQKRGLGQILIGASYVLSKREGRMGGPEKPLSSLGRKGYVTYWCGEIARTLATQSKQRTVQIKDLSEQTWILPEDLVAGLKEMDVLEKRKTASGSIVVNKSQVRAWAERNRVMMTPVVDETAFTVPDLDSTKSEVDDSDAMEE